MVGGMQKIASSSERPLPILDAQPPLPNATPVRLVEHEDEDNQEQASCQLYHTQTKCNMVNKKRVQIG